MALDQLKNVNFGKNRANATGSTGVGYTVLDISGSIITPRTTTGVYQLTSGSGLYAAYVSWPDDFRGQILWDTGTAFSATCYATEDYNVEQNDPLIKDIFDKTCDISGTVEQTFTKMCAVSGAIADICHFTTGRWIISGNQMSFYRQDNVTRIAVFDLFDQDGNPSSDCVFERTLVSGSFC